MRPMFAIALCLVAGACGSSAPPPDSDAIVNAQIDAIEAAAKKPAVSAQPALAPQPVVAGSLPSKPSARASTALQAFEASAFCRQFGCQRDKSWALKTGGTNHSYSLQVDKDISVEVPTAADDSIDNYGISFYGERERLGDSELRLVDSLLKTIDANAATVAVRKFVRGNVERPISQIREADSTPFGQYRLWAGKVGNEQIVSIGKP